MVESRNTADNMIHASRKSIEELGDKVEEQEKTDVEAAIADVEEALKGDSKEAIDEKTAKLTEVAGKLAERVYQQSAEEGQAEAGATEGSADPQDDVVDAEFEEVKDDDK
jgi:molecular chaperone DnaK